MNSSASLYLSSSFGIQGTSLPRNIYKRLLSVTRVRRTAPARVSGPSLERQSPLRIYWLLRSPASSSVLLTFPLVGMKAKRGTGRTGQRQSDNARRP